MTIHSIVRDGHRADCEAQTEGCRVMGVMESIADEQLSEVGRSLRGSVGSSASRGRAMFGRGRLNGKAGGLVRSDVVQGEAR